MGVSMSANGSVGKGEMDKGNIDPPVSAKGKVGKGEMGKGNIDLLVSAKGKMGKGETGKANIDPLVSAEGKMGKGNMGKGEMVSPVRQPLAAALLSAAKGVISEMLYPEVLKYEPVH